MRTPEQQNAIRNLHGCESTWVESVPVKETFQGQTVWEGEVQVLISSMLWYWPY